MLYVREVHLTHCLVDWDLQAFALWPTLELFMYLDSVARQSLCMWRAKLSWKCSFSCGKVCCFFTISDCLDFAIAFSEVRKESSCKCPQSFLSSTPATMLSRMRSSRFSAKFTILGQTIPIKLVKECSPNSCLFVNWGIQFCLSSYTQEDNCHNE